MCLLICFSGLYQSKELSFVIIFKFCVSDLGLIKLDVKTKTPSGLAFNASGSSSTETNKVLANVEADYTHNRYGLTMKEKWDCDNNLSAEISHRDKIIKGLTIGGRNSVILSSKSHKGSVLASVKEI